MSTRYPIFIIIPLGKPNVYLRVIYLDRETKPVVANSHSIIRLVKAGCSFLIKQVDSWYNWMKLNRKVSENWKYLLCKVDRQLSAINSSLLCSWTLARNKITVLLIPMTFTLKFLNIYSFYKHFLLLYNFQTLKFYYK